MEIVDEVVMAFLNRDLKNHWKDRYYFIDFIRYVNNYFGPIAGSVLTAKSLGASFARYNYDIRYGTFKNNHGDTYRRMMIVRCKDMYEEGVV